MIRVETKKLKEYLFGREQRLIRQTDLLIFDSRRFLIHPAVAALGLGVILFVNLWTSRLCLVLFLTEAIALTALYLHTWLIARKVKLKRILPNKTLRELDSAEVIIEIQNRSDFYISGLLIDDVFGVAKDSLVRLAPDRLRGRSMVRFSYQRFCDGGMGQHSVGPLIARLTDALGLFEFRIIEDTIHEVEVYPRVERIPDVVVHPTNQTPQYGNYEAAARGISVNFAGVRPYERGDSLRHIAWKLSLRGQGLLVKEFEKVVNCDVNIVLNLAPQWQIGRQSNSTWEAAKDAALAVVQQQLDLGNTVSFFTNGSFIEAGVGGDHFHYVAKHVASLNPILDRNQDPENLQIDPTPILSVYRELYARGSNIFYVTPFNTYEFKRSGPWLRRLRAEGFSVTCIFVDSNSYWLQFLDSVSTGLLVGATLMQGVEAEAAELRRSGIETFIVKDKMSLRDAFRTRLPESRVRG